MLVATPFVAFAMAVAVLVAFAVAYCVVGPIAAIAVGAAHLDARLRGTKLPEWSEKAEQFLAAMPH